MRKTKVLKSLQEMDRRNLKLPMAVIYQKPKDYPDDYVVRIFEGTTGRPTEMVILRKTLEECRKEVLEAGFYVALPRAAADDPVIVESWI